MVDEELKSKMASKVEDGSLSPADIPEYMDLLVQICNEEEEIQEEVEDWNRKFFCKIEGAEDLWLKIEDQKFSTGKGTIEEPDITFEFDADVAIGIFSGEVDATQAYMSNELKVIGALPDAVRFKTITELVRDEVEE